MSSDLTKKSEDGRKAAAGLSADLSRLGRENEELRDALRHLAEGAEVLHILARSALAKAKSGA